MISIFYDYPKNSFIKAEIKMIEENKNKKVKKKRKEKFY